VLKYELERLKCKASVVESVNDKGKRLNGQKEELMRGLMKLL